MSHRTDNSLPRYPSQHRVTVAILLMMAFTWLLAAAPAVASERRVATRKTSSSHDTKSTSNTSQFASLKDAAALDEPVDLDPKRVNVELLNQEIIRLTNLERTNRNLQPVRSQTGLAKAALLHSEDMVGRNYFDHKSRGFLGSTSPAERVAAQGVQFRMVAENLAMIPLVRSSMVRSDGATVAMDRRTYSDAARYTVDQWLKSPGHRRNLLNPDLNAIGMGTSVKVQRGVPYLYITQNFALVNWGLEPVAARSEEGDSRAEQPRYRQLHR